MVLPRKLLRARDIPVITGIVAAIAGVFLLFRHIEQSYDRPNYSLIEDGLYLGGRVPAPPAGTDVVVNLCEQEDTYPCDRWEPIRDGSPAPDLSWLQELTDYIRQNRDEGKTVYVHCRNGVSRSGMLAVACLMSDHGWGRDQALGFVRTQRPEVRPNPAFMDLLREWEKQLAVQPRDSRRD